MTVNHLKILIKINMLFYNKYFKNLIIIHKFIVKLIGTVFKHLWKPQLQKKINIIQKNQ